MNTRTIREITEKCQDFSYLLTDIGTETSGFPMVIWIAQEYKTKFGCNMKVSIRNGKRGKIFKWFGITILEPKTIGRHKINDKKLYLVKKFILLNEKVILNHWNWKSSSIEFINEIKKVNV